jgi:hypothetical protein
MIAFLACSRKRVYRHAVTYGLGICVMPALLSAFEGKSFSWAGPEISFMPTAPLAVSSRSKRNKDTIVPQWHNKTYGLLTAAYVICYKFTTL